MRKGFQSLALLVQQTLKQNPHGGHLFVFRGRRGDLLKIIWHDGPPPEGGSFSLKTGDAQGIAGRLSFHKKIGTRAFYLAHIGRRRSIAVTGAARLYARRHRLAGTATNMEYKTGVLSMISAEIFAIRIMANRAAPVILCAMDLDPASLPDDIATLKAMLIATTKRADTLDAEIANLKLTIAKLQHSKYGSSSERARLLDQLELQLSELEEQVAQNAAADEIAAQEPAAAKAPAKKKPLSFRPARRPLPAHLP
jgi:hypothetical protein